MHSVTLSPESSKWTRTEVCVDLEALLELGEDVLEAASLAAACGGLGVAVHRVAAPQHRAFGTLDRLDQRRQTLGHLRVPHAVDQRQTPGLRIRVEDFKQLE